MMLWLKFIGVYWKLTPRTSFDWIKTIYSVNSNSYNIKSKHILAFLNTDLAQVYIVWDIMVKIP